MANFEQAPLLKSKGEKNRNDKSGMAIRTHHLESLIMNGIDGKCGAQLKIMFFLTGNAANVGFAVAEKTIMSRCGISETTYKNARKALVKKGWIIHKPSKDGVQGEIVVDYDAIYATENKKNEGNLKNEDYIDSTPKTNIENIEQNSEKTPTGDIEDTYNIITNSINSNNRSSNNIKVKNPIAWDTFTDENGNFKF